MKIVAVIGLTVLMLSGCAQFQRTEVIDTDKLAGYASGEYRETCSGPNGRFGLAGSGAGWSGGGGGFGLGALSVNTGPPRSGSYDFARAIAMINYSKKLKSIKYDECGGVIDYKFEQTPLSSQRSDYQEYGSKAQLPSSFGHQPIE